MLQGEHSAIFSTFIKLPFVIKIFILSIFEWLFYTGFTVLHFPPIRTSDGGNGNHSVSLPIILIKIKVDQKLISSHISSLLVSIFFKFAFDFLFAYMYCFILGLKWSLFVL